MVQKIINDLSNLKNRIYNNISYSNNNKQLAMNIIDNVINALNKVGTKTPSIFNSSHINNVLNNIGQKGVKYETKPMIHSNINSIKNYISRDNNISANLTEYCNKNLDKVKRL